LTLSEGYDVSVQVLEELIVLLLLIGSVRAVPSQPGALLLDPDSLVLAEAHGLNLEHFFQRGEHFGLLPREVPAILNLDIHLLSLFEHMGSEVAV